VSYSSDVKFDLLHVPVGEVVTADAAVAMAAGVRELLHTDVSLSVTGVAGPAQQEGKPVGLVFGALALPGEPPRVVELQLSGSRKRIREMACLHLLDALRLALLEMPTAST
jgi:PncC family amidohydrolase